LHLLQLVSIPVLRVHIILFHLLLMRVKRVQLYGREAYGIRENFSVTVGVGRL